MQELVITSAAVSTLSASDNGSSLPVPPPMTWERALAAWLPRLQSPLTRATYGGQVRAFFGVPGVPDELAALDWETLETYAAALRKRIEADTPPAARLAPATVNLKLASLRSFLDFCRRPPRRWLAEELTGEAIHEALQDAKAHVQRPYQIVDDDELLALLEAAATDAWDGPRALALVALALGAGLRVAELCSLDVGDLSSDKEGTFLDVREGKGRRQRQVPISESTYQLAISYLSATGRAVYRTVDRATPLFLSRKCRTGSGRLTTRQARRIVVAAAARAGITERGKRITPHSLRHTYAIDVLDGDAAAGRPPAPLAALSAMMGHSSIAMTGKYLHHYRRRDQAKFAPALPLPAAIIQA